VPTGSGDALVAGHHDALVDLGGRYAAAFPENGSDLAASVYYDLAYVLYTIHHRTQDPYFREQARRVARAWRDSPQNQAIEPFLGGDWSAGRNVPPPRDLATLGLALLALEADDAGAREVVHQQARLMEQHWVNSTGDYGLSNPVMPLGDQRESAYALMALVTSTLLGEDHAPAARRLLDAILDHQLPNGQWQGWVEGGYIFTNNFMIGLLLEALALYDRAIGDSRIVPAMERAMGWLWSTQWVSSTLSFRYDAEGTVTGPAPVLNGLFLAGWGHVHSATGKAAYRDQGEQILRGLVERGVQEIWSVKQFDQLFRASSQYLGYTRGL
jgi:hypothetical protein